MPCNGYSLAEEEALDRELEIRKFGDTKDNILTRLACDYCKLIDQGTEENPLPKQVPKWARAWWKDHQRLDKRKKESKARRKAEKKLRESALAKLSPEERKLLGVGVDLPGDRTDFD